jgi:excisionase family DNA binding protein
MGSDNLLTVKEAAERLGVHVNTVRNWIANGTLKSARPAGARHHRFDPAEVERVRLAHGRKPEPVGRDRLVIGPELADATQLGAWADRTEARTVFPRLIRRLLAATAGVEALTGRAGEGVAFGGWDAEATLREATSRLPRGDLRFEFGVNKVPSKKAQDDYDNRIKAYKQSGLDPKSEWFVFATPRRWGGAKAWAEERSKEGVWAGVVALDGDDIEGWLDDTPTVHYWISEQLGLKPFGVESLEAWWGNFEQRIRPTIPIDFFLAGREAARDKLLELLNTPDDKPIGVRAGWRDDALAFVAAALGTSNEEATPPRPALVVRSEEVWRRLLTEPGPAVLVPIFRNRNNTAVASASKRVIVPFGKDEVSTGTEAVTLAPPHRLTAAEVLREQGGFDSDRADRYTALARRNMPALVRRLSTNPVFARPPWSEPPAVDMFAPLVLVGSWADVEPDRAVVEELVGRPWQDIERTLRRAADSDDPPFVQSGYTWRVASREEAFEVLAPQLTSDDLRRWAEITVRVLNERDPRRHMPFEERVLLEAQTTQQQFASQTLREGLAEGLALLGARGEPAAAGSFSGGYVEQVVRRLLQDASSDSSCNGWAAISHELPRLAEAAPRVFLDEVLRHSIGDQPLLRGIFRDGDDRSSWDTSSPHSSLLWAMETLCWSPDYLMDATRVLAQLDAIDPGGRLANRPTGSLSEVLVLWIRQTGAPVSTRLAALDQIAREFPVTAWKLIERLWPSGHATTGVPATPVYRDWKPDERGVPMTEYYALVERVVRLAVGLAATDVARWTELLGWLGPLPPELREYILNEFRGRLDRLLEVEADRLVLWETLAKEVDHHREFATADWSMPAGVVDGLAELADRIEPTGNVERYAKLFDWRPDIGTQRRDNHEQYEVDLKRLREEALQATLNLDGLDGVARVAGRARVPGHVGWTLADLTADEHRDVLLGWLDADDAPRAAVAGAWARQRGWDDDRWIEAGLKDAPSDSARLRLIVQFPTGPRIWTTLDSYPCVADEYWKALDPWGVPPEHVSATAGHLLSHERPVTAVTVLASAMHGENDAEESLGADLVVGALQAVLTTPEDVPHQSNSLGYEVGQLLDFLDGKVPLETLAQLEFAFFRALEHHRYPRALYRALGTEPELFVDLVSRLYRPKNGPRVGTTDEKAQTAATHAWHVLHDWRTVPGTREDGTIDGDDLQRWVDAARLQLRDADRVDVGDSHIGQVLAGSAAGADGAWPAEPVRDLLERLGSSEIEEGLQIGKYNLRGVTMRGAYDGGGQERQLAQQFKAWSARTAGRWPRTSRVLQEMALTYDREAERNDMRAQEEADAG